jgi:hypothetical protein
MSPLPKAFKILSAIGYGVLFALALTGGVRIVAMLMGTTLSESMAGNIFMITSLLAGSLTGWLGVRALSDPLAKTAATTSHGSHD